MADIDGYVGRGVTGGGDPVRRLRQPRALTHPHGRQLAAAVDLLGDVGQVEVRGERPPQPRRARRVQPGEDGGGGLTFAAHEIANALEQVEQLRPLLPDQGQVRRRVRLELLPPQSAVIVSVLAWG